MRKIVMPGDLIAKNPKVAGHGTYIESGKVYAKFLGLLDKTDSCVRVIPLKGRYIPSQGDVVIGIVREFSTSGWVVDIYSPYQAFLPSTEYPENALKNRKINEVLRIGDAIIAKVLNIDLKKKVTLTMKDRVCKPIKVGRVVAINPARVPRVIGKKGSMIKLLKSELDVQIVVGQNGLIWLNGDRKRVSIAEKAIYKIEEEAHTEGLTDRITEFIKEMRDDKSYDDKSEDVGETENGEA